MKPIYLVGLMGSGKSLVGRALARELKWRFADTDSLVVKREGRSISRIFSESGEARFRSLEQRALRSIPAGPTVVATGGGIVISAQNRAWMRRRGVMLHLKVPLKVLEKRLKDRQAAKRPLLSQLRLLARKRAAFYASSRITVRADRPVQAVVASILLHLQRKMPQVLADKTAR